jgi:transposase
MTNIVLSIISSVTDLAMFSTIYNKGEIQLNISKLASDLGKDRKTIRKYLKGEIPKQTRERAKYLDKYRSYIIVLLSDKHRSFDYIDHLYRFLVREKGITCSRSTLNRYIRKDDELNSLYNKKRKDSFIERFETKPGQQAQFDLKERMKIVLTTGERITVNVATLTLGWSRYNVRKIVLDTKYETISSFLAESFEIIGGVPKELVIDNIKCLVNKPRTSTKDAILNVKFIEFLKDYNIKALPCMPYRPQTKGKTETQNKIPNALYNYNGTYKDLMDVHDCLEIINNEDNQGISQATKLPRDFLLSKEKDDFSSLPTRSIREIYHLSLIEVAVSKESLVSYKARKYSVPKRFIGSKVGLVIKRGELHIYYNSKIITMHKITKNLLNIKPEHQLQYIKKVKQKIEDNQIILHEMRNIQYDNS